MQYNIRAKSNMTHKCYTVVPRLYNPLLVLEEGKNTKSNI
jgi:hypothetical protein